MGYLSILLTRPSDLIECLKNESKSGSKITTRALPMRLKGRLKVIVTFTLRLLTINVSVSRRLRVVH